MQERKQTAFPGRSLNSAISCGALLCGATLLVLSSVQAAGLYKWVDENGQVRYSDRLPPAQVKQGHQQLNSQGLVIGTQDGEMTEEEKAAHEEQLKLQAEEDKRLAEEAELAAKQREKDRVLIMTFTSEEELTEVFNGRATVIDSIISLIEKSLASTEKQLETLRADAEKTYTSKGKEVPGGLAQRIEFAESKIKSRTEQLVLKQTERARLMETYQRDLDRYRTLTTKK